MQTWTLNIADPHLDEDGVREAGTALADGALVIFPTETVYGIGASAVSREAVNALSRLKDRSPDKPFTLHLADPREAERYAGSLPPLAERLIRKAWPGPLTLVVPDRRRSTRTGLVEDAVYYGGTVGLRCPAHDVGRAVLRAAGVPIVATSANLAGAPAPHCLAEALAQLSGKVPLAVDSGPCQHTRPSSVVRIGADDTLEVLREGAITAHRVQRLSRTRIVFVCTGNICRSPMAAGLAREKLARRHGCRPDELGSRGIQVLSVGTGAVAGYPASDNAVQAMAERGIDIRSHRSQPMTVDAVDAADYIWVMTGGHRRSVLSAAPHLESQVELIDPQERDVPDPIGGDLEVYRACARQIEQALADRMAEII